MILLILSDEEEQQVLTRLLSPTLASVHVGRHPLSLRNVPWSEEERDVIRGCSSALEARRAYRAAYPSSDRTDDAIARQYFRLHSSGERGGGAEVEALDEPVEPEVAETIEGPDLYRLDPAPAPMQQCPGEEVTLSREPEPLVPPAEPEPEKKRRKPRKNSWPTEEEDVIADCSGYRDAVAAYRAAYPEGTRTDAAIRSRWDVLQKRPRVGKTVRIDLPNSSMHEKTGTVLKIGAGGDRLVSVDGSPSSIWIAPERLTVVQEGSK